jgi:hypothetical protein
LKTTTTANINSPFFSKASGLVRGKKIFLETEDLSDVDVVHDVNVVVVHLHVVHVVLAAHAARSIQGASAIKN